MNKNDTIYKKRLLLFADYLDCMDNKMRPEAPADIIFHHLDKNGPGQMELQYFAWIFADMPYIAEEWIFNQHDKPVLLEEPESTVNSVFIYFGIESPSVFRHLFCPYSQLEKYNGILLSDRPMPSDIAKNIEAFVKSYPL